MRPEGLFHPPFSSQISLQNINHVLLSWGVSTRRSLHVQAGLLFFNFLCSSPYVLVALSRLLIATMKFRTTRFFVGFELHLTQYVHLQIEQRAVQGTNAQPSVWYQGQDTGDNLVCWGLIPFEGVSRCMLHPSILLQTVILYRFTQNRSIFFRSLVRVHWHQFVISPV